MNIHGFLLSVFLALPLSAAAAQDPSSPEARVKVIFRAFDLNSNASLSGSEITGCGCGGYDADGNGQITWEEFRAGYAQAPLFGGAPRPVAPAAAPAAQTRFAVGDTVEVNVDGTWYRASVVGIRDGRYALSRQDRAFGVTTDNEWVAAERLRPYVAPAAVLPRIPGLPQSVPVGTYSCMTYGTGSNVGKLRILGNGVSSGVTPDGAGGEHRFSYDAATGAITWADGMKIAGWAVEMALFKPLADGKPNINLHYRLRAGGNLNSMSCLRE
jgi:hypothetical protein